MKSKDEVLKYFIRTNNPLIFDVGANDGDTIARMEELFLEPTVHAFEPLARTFQNLQQRYKNSHHILNNLGLSDKETELDVYVLPGRGSTTSFERRNGLNKVQELETISCITLDSYLTKLDVEQVDILKIDVETAEPLVLAGAINLLSTPSKRPRVVELELHLGNFFARHRNFFDLEQYLVPNGYRLVYASKGTGMLPPNDMGEGESIEINLLNEPLTYLDVLYVSPETQAECPLPIVTT